MGGYNILSSNCLARKQLKKNSKLIWEKGIAVQQPSSVKIHVVVIGQGDAILLETEGRLLQQYDYQQPA